MRIYVGGYTDGPSDGITLFEWDGTDGKLTRSGSIAQTSNPSFLALHPSKPFLYAVNEVGEFEGRKTGRVTAFSIEETTGALTFINQQDSGGTGPCHLTVDQQERFVYVANYGSGSFAALPLNQGTLEPAVQRIDHSDSGGANAHGVHVDASGQYLMVPDLGMEKVYIYHRSHDGTLAAAKQPFAPLEGGSGPRHLAFHPSEKWTYVINEKRSTVTQFEYDSTTGALSELNSVSILPAGFEGENHASEICVHPSGRYLYAGNRGHDSIAILDIDPETGKLTLRDHVHCGGSWPRHFALESNGGILAVANEKSDSIVLFTVESKTGNLIETARAVTKKPTCVLFSSPSLSG